MWRQVAHPNTNGLKAVKKPTQSTTTNAFRVTCSVNVLVKTVLEGRRLPSSSLTQKIFPSSPHHIFLNNNQPTKLVTKQKKKTKKNCSLWWENYGQHDTDQPIYYSLVYHRLSCLSVLTFIHRLYTYSYISTGRQVQSIYQRNNLWTNSEWYKISMNSWN